MTAPRGPLSHQRAPLRPVVPTEAGRPEAWTPDRIQTMIFQEMTDAKNYAMQFVAPERAEALKYYRGDEDIVPVQEGRSRVVSMDLRDTTLAMMPSLVRIFLGGERWAEFLPTRVEGEKAARQRMDYINHVAFNDNRGFQSFYAWFKEALALRYSPLKWWWDERVTVENETYTGLLRTQVESLAADSDITDVQYEEDGETILPPEAIAAPGDVVGVIEDALTGPRVRVKTYTVRIRKERTEGRARYAVLPGEEFYTDREATTLEDARIISHIRYVSRSDLVALGYTADFVAEHDGADFNFEQNSEFLVRNPHRVSRTDAEGTNEDLEVTLYGEHLVRFDEDGDGIAELHKVCTIGSDYFVAKVEDAPEINYTILCPDPEAHMLLGSGLHRRLKDVQRVKTATLRGTNDAFRQTIDPRLVVNQDAVNLEDAANQELGGLIRTDGDPNQTVRILETPFTGQAGLLMLEYWDGVKKSRGGMDASSTGLDGDQIQSTTKMAIAAQLSASQQQIEMIARVFAETGVRDLFMGLQRLVMRHQDAEREVRLRGEWVTINPKTWDAPLDLIVNVGLGSGLPEDRIQRLLGIKESQEAYLQNAGPTPMVDFSHLRYTNAKIVELAGYGDASVFFGEVPPGWTPPPPPAPPPDPAVQVAQIQLQIEQQKREAEEIRSRRDAETARLKIEADFNLKLLELQSAAATEDEANRLQASIEAARLAVSRENIATRKGREPENA